MEKRIKKQRHHLAGKSPCSQSCGFSSTHVQMWGLDHKKGWVPKNWCFLIVVLEKTLGSPLDCKEIRPVNPKGCQPWIFIGRTDAEAPILWPSDTKSWLTGKDLDAGKDWRQKEKGATGLDGWMASAGSMHMNVSKLRETAKDGEAWRAPVRGVKKSQAWPRDWITATTFQILKLFKEHTKQLISMSSIPQAPHSASICVPSRKRTQPDAGGVNTAASYRALSLASSLLGTSLWAFCSFEEWRSVFSVLRTRIVQSSLTGDCFTIFFISHPVPSNRALYSSRPRNIY